MCIFWGPHYRNVPYYKVFEKIPKKNRKMHVFSLIFIPSFPFLYHFDTVLGPFFGWVGGGGDSPHPHGTLEGKKN